VWSASSDSFSTPEISKADRRLPCEMLRWHSRHYINKSAYRTTLKSVTPGCGLMLCNTCPEAFPELHA